MCSHFMYPFPEIKWGYFRKMSSAFMNAGKGPLLFQSPKCQVSCWTWDLPSALRALKALFKATHLGKRRTWFLTQF